MPEPGDELTLTGTPGSKPHGPDPATHPPRVTCELRPRFGDVPEAVELGVKRVATPRPCSVVGQGCNQEGGEPPMGKASSAESVGEFWFGQVAKCVIQSDFQCPGGAEPIRPFGDHSGLSVEAFDNATGELPPGSEPVQNQVAVRAQPCGQPPSSGRAASASSGCTSGRGTGRPSTATRSPTAIESPP